MATGNHRFPQERQSGASEVREANKIINQVEVLTREQNLVTSGYSLSGLRPGQFQASGPFSPLHVVPP